MGESGLEVSYLITEPRKNLEVTWLSANIRNPWLKATLKYIDSLIKNKTFLVDEQEKVEPVTPCMGVYKEKIQSDGSLDKLKLRIVVRGCLQNNYLIGETWSPTASMSNLKYFLSDAVR